MRWALAAFLGALVALGVWMRWDAGLEPPSSDGTAEHAAESRYHLDQLSALRTDDLGHPLLRVTAESADYFDGGAALLSKLQADGLSGNAAPWQLTSPTGSVPAGEKRLLLHSPVQGTGRWPDGEPFDFKGQDVWIDDTKRRLSSNQPINIASATRSAHARSFSASLDGRTLQMNNVELTYAIQP